MNRYVTCLLPHGVQPRHGTFAVERVSTLAVRLYSDPREGPDRPAVDLAAVLWFSSGAATEPTAPPAPKRLAGPTRSYAA